VISGARRSGHEEKLEAGRGHLDREVKFGIKTLDLDRLDRSRAKVEGAVHQINEAAKMTDFTVAPCHDIHAYMKSICYFVRRAEALRSQAQIMLEVAQKTLEWCGQVEHSVNAVRNDPSDGG